MNKIALLIALTIPKLVTATTPDRYQLPAVLVCRNDECPVAISNDGDLVESESHKTLFPISGKDSVFESYVLLMSGDKYILERSNTSSSRNWDALIFKYSSGSINAVRVISLARSFTMTPSKIEWGGYECRGEARLNGKTDPYEAATKALCGVVPNVEHENLPNSELIKQASAKGLVVNVPVYENGARKSSIYVFPGSEEPDAGALLCMKNCGVPPADMHYGGWIGKSAWVDVSLQTTASQSGGLDGGYVYLTKGVRIPLKGELARNQLKLDEFGTEAGEQEHATATMTGTFVDDAIKGVWSSRKAAKTYDFLLARRVY